MAYISSQDARRGGRVSALSFGINANIRLTPTEAHRFAVLAVRQSNALLRDVSRPVIREAGIGVGSLLMSSILRWRLRLLYLTHLAYWGIRHRSISSALWVMEFEGRKWN